MKTILVADRDNHNLAAMSEAFKRAGYGVITMDRGLSALDILNTLDIDLVISDTQIYQMDGYELLSRVKERHPEVIRIIMGNSGEEAAAFKAILHNAARFNIIKPWNKEKLLESIGHIFETEDLLKTSDLLQLISSAETLPTIEANYQKILNMIERDANLGAISAEIEKDFAISSKLLKIANSAYYGLQTGSVKHAAVYLGLHNLKSLIYSTSILDSFHSVSEQDQRRVNNLWTHSLITSKLLHYIYEVFLCKKLPETAYSAGLLHNVGTLILLQNRIEDYTKAVNKAQTKDLNMLEMEREAFHVTHHEAGGYLVSRWKLPFPIIESALYHHIPLDPRILNKEIVAAVHLAQHYAWMLTQQPVVTEFFPETFDILNIPVSGFEAAVNWKNWL